MIPAHVAVDVDVLPAGWVIECACGDVTVPAADPFAAHGRHDDHVVAVHRLTHPEIAA